MATVNTVFNFIPLTSGGVSIFNDGVYLQTLWDITATYMQPDENFVVVEKFGSRSYYPFEGATFQNNGVDITGTQSAISAALAQLFNL